MSFKNAGILEVFFSSPSANFPAALTGLTADPPTLFALGLRKEATLTVEPFNALTDKDNRQFPNMTNYKIEGNTMQIDLPTIKGLIDLTKAGGATVAAVMAGAVNNANVVTSAGGIFMFENAASLGLDFELKLTQSERILNVIFEGAYIYSATDAILANLATESIPYLADKIPNIDTTKVISGFRSPVDMGLVPTALTLSGAFANKYIDDFSVSLKSIGDKSGFNRTILKGFQVELSATAIGVDNADVAEIMKQEFPSSNVTIELQTGKTIVLNAKGLSRNGSISFSDAKRTGTVKYSGTYYADFITSTASAITFGVTL